MSALLAFIIALFLLL